MFQSDDILNNPEATNLALCIFPHLKEFAVIDLRESNNEDLPIKIFNSNEILDDHFFSLMEGEFRKLLKNDEFPFLNLIGLPQNIENLIRTHTLSSILDILKTSNNTFNDISTIAVLFFSGRILDISNEELEKLFENLFQDRLTSTQINKSIEKISKLISSERDTQKKLIKNDLYGIITGKNESFATLWERGNI